MKRILVLSVFALLLFCSNTANSNSDCPADQRTGAVCKDGTTSTATGSGACSGHGGVDHWICGN